MGDVSTVDMSLDDIIRLKKKSQKRSAATGGGRGRGSFGRGGRGASRGRGGVATRDAAASASSNAPGLKKRGSWRRRGSASARATTAAASPRGAGRSAQRAARAADRGRLAGRAFATARGRGSAIPRQSLANRVAATARLRLHQRQTGGAAASGASKGPSFAVGRLGDVRRRLQQRRLQSLRTTAALRTRRLAATSAAANAILSAVRAAAGSRVANRLSPRTAMNTDRAERAADFRRHQREQRFQTQAAARHLHQALAGLTERNAEVLSMDYPASSSRSGSLYSDRIPAAPRLLSGAARSPVAVQQNRRQFASSSYAGSGSPRALTSRDFERTSPRAYTSNRPSLSVTVPGATQEEGLSWRSASQPAAQRQQQASVSRPAAAVQVRPAAAASKTTAASSGSSATSRRRELELLGRIKELESELAAARQKRQQHQTDFDDYEVEGTSVNDDEEEVMEHELEDVSDAADENALATSSAGNSRIRLQVDSVRKSKNAAAVVQQRPGGKSSNRHVIS